MFTVNYNKKYMTKLLKFPLKLASSSLTYVNYEQMPSCSFQLRCTKFGTQDFASYPNTLELDPDKVIQFLLHSQVRRSRRQTLMRFYTDLFLSLPNSQLLYISTNLTLSRLSLHKIALYYTGDKQHYGHIQTIFD